MPRRLQPLKVLAAVAAKGAAMAKGTTKGKGGGGGSGKSGTKAAAATATAAAGAAAAAEAEAVAESAKRQSSGSEDEVEVEVVFFLAPVSGGSAPTSVKGLHQVSVTLPVNQSLEGDPEEKQLEKELDSDSDEDAWHVPLVGKLAVAVQLAKRRVGPASVGKFALINETDLPVLRATRLCLL